MNERDIYIKSFIGTVDQLLEKVSKLDLTKLNDNPILNHSEMVEMVSNDEKISKEEAEVIVNQIQLKEFNNVLDGMVSEGILEKVFVKNEITGEIEEKYQAVMKE